MIQCKVHEISVVDRNTDDNEVIKYLRLSSEQLNGWSFISDTVVDKQDNVGALISNCNRIYSTWLTSIENLWIRCKIGPHTRQLHTETLETSSKGSIDIWKELTNRSITTTCIEIDKLVDTVKRDTTTWSSTSCGSGWPSICGSVYLSWCLVEISIKLRWIGQCTMHLHLRNT